jgi:hypothetical protein
VADGEGTIAAKGFWLLALEEAGSSRQSTMMLEAPCCSAAQISWNEGVSRVISVFGWSGFSTVAI